MNAWSIFLYGGISASVAILHHIRPRGRYWQRRRLRWWRVQRRAAAFAAGPDAARQWLKGKEWKRYRAWWKQQPHAKGG